MSIGKEEWEEYFRLGDYMGWGHKTGKYKHLDTSKEAAPGEL
jgi:hypothetical protein